MAITFVLVAQGSNHLEYLATSAGSTAAFDTGTIQPAGAGDADVALEDAVVPPAAAHWNAGLLKQIVDLSLTSQAQARRAYLDWGLPPVALDGILNVSGKRARAYIVPIVPAGQEVLKSWSIDADTAAERGEYNVACTAAGTARALIVIEAIGTPQQF